MIQESFKKAGVYDYSKGSYDLHQIINQCNTTISPEVAMNILNNISKLATLMMINGEIKDADFARFGIDDGFSEAVTQKDRLIVSRRRMCILTNRRFIQSEEQKRVDKRAQDLDLEDKKKKRKAVASTKKQNKKVRTEVPINQKAEEQPHPPLVLKLRMPISL